MPRVCIGIGTNRGVKTHNISMALEKLSTLLRNIRVSSIYESEPYGNVNQPNFYNLVVCGETTVPPIELLSCLKRFERLIGRTPSKRWGPREIDLDMLTYGSMRMDTPFLSIPHPDMSNRVFVIIPLIEIEPGILYRMPPAVEEIRRNSRITIRKIGKFSAVKPPF